MRVTCTQLWALRPGTSRGPKLGGCLPHPQRLAEGTLGFAEAAPPGGQFREHTSHPQPWGVPTLLPSAVLPLRRAQAFLERGSLLLNLPSETFAKRSVLTERRPLGPQKSPQVGELVQSYRPSLRQPHSRQRSTVFSGSGILSPSGKQHNLNTHTTFPTFSLRHNHSVCLVHQKVPCPFFP